MVELNGQRVDIVRFFGIVGIQGLGIRAHVRGQEPRALSLTSALLVLAVVAVARFIHIGSLV